MAPELYANMYEKLENNRFYDKRYNFKPNEDFFIQVRYDNFEIGVHIVIKFQVYIFSTD